MSFVKVIDKLILSEAEELRYFGEVIVFSEIIAVPNWDDWEPFLYDGLFYEFNSVGVKRW